MNKKKDFGSYHVLTIGILLSYALLIFAPHIIFIAYALIHIIFGFFMIGVDWGMGQGYDDTADGKNFKTRKRK